MRSGRPEVFYKESILINYAKFRRQRPVHESLFQKGCRMEICHFIKKRYSGIGVFQLSPNYQAMR